MSITNKVLNIVFFLALSNVLLAQPTDNSPYSSFGIGNIHDDNLVFFQAMGNLGASFIDGNHLNLKNPASYAFLGATAFETGISGKFTQISDGNQSGNIWQGNLDYLALGFPLRNPINDALDRVNNKYSLGMSLYLKPHSTVGYNISSEFSDTELGDYTKNFAGSGGSYKMMWGNGVRYKNLGFGANIGYLFGNIQFNENIFFDDLSFALENRHTIDYNINGFIWDAGVIYNLFLNKEEVAQNNALNRKVLNFGIYGNSAQNFYTKADIVRRTLFEEAQISDTLYSENLVKGEGRLPAEFGIGVSYMDGADYGIGINFDYGAWSAYKNSVREETLSNSFQLSIGGFYRPNPKAFNRYFQRVAYKFGAFYQKDPQVINGKQVTDTGINLGATFPFYYQRKISHVNAAFRLGIKGNGTPISEKYVRLAFGFTFNDDEWFIQRKYN